MWILELDCTPEEKDLLIAGLWEAGTSGITETECGLRAFFEDASARPALERRFSRQSPRWEEAPEQDWVAQSRSGWQPLEVGRRFFLVPEWLDDPAPPGRFRIAVNPGMAFGTGLHETTRLCLEALERHLRPGARVLDVGAGSGILALAARLLGAGRVAGCDIDPEAVEIASQRAHGAAFFIGSIQAIAGASADLVVCNVSAAVSTGIAPDIGRCLAPGGLGILSGFEQFEASQVRAALEAAGMRPFEERGENTWRMIAARAR